MVKANLKTLQLDRITRELLDATLKGFAVGEVMWGIGSATRAAASSPWT